MFDFSCAGAGGRGTIFTILVCVVHVTRIIYDDVQEYEWFYLDYYHLGLKKITSIAGMKEVLQRPPMRISEDIGRRWGL